MHLGVFQIFVHTVLWDLIICDLWRASQGMGVQKSDANGGLRLEYELSQWYKKEKAAGTRPIHEMPDFSIKTLGSRCSRELKAKAAESSTLLFFAIDMIEKHKARMSNPTRCLKLVKLSGREYMDITRSHGLRLPTAAGSATTGSRAGFERSHDRLIASYLCFLHAREPGNPTFTWLSTLCCLLGGSATTGGPHKKSNTICTKQVFSNGAALHGVSSAQVDPH